MNHWKHIADAVSWLGIVLVVASLAYCVTTLNKQDNDYALEKMRIQQQRQ